MARLAERLPDNVPGEFYVDRSCIDCDTCRQIAPSIFGTTQGDDASCVIRQPETADETRRSLMALVACPTSSIGTVHKIDPGPGVRAFPERIADEVYYLGFCSESSFGASSYLLRPGKDGVVVDSPRAARPLLRRIEALGGASRIFLTHRDDVADHAVLAARLGARRILHADDVEPETAAVEQKLEGREPVRLGEDLLAIPVPGHTRGSTALLCGETYLFTGDHLWWSETCEGLWASRGVCWYSWAEQRRSIERLLDFRFEWVLPGHGRRWHAPSAAAMRAEIERLLRALPRG